MKIGFPRSSKGKSGRTESGEPPIDVFEQTERSLLGEALGRPVGLLSAIILLSAAGTFLANHFYFEIKRIDDFALVGFFVGGGLLLSVLLRAGDSNPASKRPASAGRASERDNELFIEQPELFERRRDNPAAAGLAEPAAAAAPVPPDALVKPEAVKPAPDPADDEVASFQKALVHYVDAGDFHGQGEVLRRLGHLAKARGHLKESRDFYVNSRNCFRKIDDHYAEAAVLLDLGQVLESLDEHDAASAAYRDANRALLDVAMNSGDRYNAVQAHAAD